MGQSSARQQAPSHSLAKFLGEHFPPEVRQEFKVKRKAKTENDQLRELQPTVREMARQLARRLRLPFGDLYSLGLEGAWEGIQHRHKSRFNSHDTLGPISARRFIGWRMLVGAVELGSRFAMPLFSGNNGEAAVKLRLRITEWGLAEPLTVPSIEKLANHFGVSTSVVETVYLAQLTDAAIAQGKEETLALAKCLPQDRMEAERPNPEDVSNGDSVKRQVARMLSRLTSRQERVLRLRFGFDNDSWGHTLQEIGDEFGVSQNRIRQIENKALRKLAAPEQKMKLIGRPGINRLAAIEDWYSRRQEAHSLIGEIPYEAN